MKQPIRHLLRILLRLLILWAIDAVAMWITIGLLHQGFNAYAHQLSQSAQKEWEKVAGRFEEVLFDQPLEQVTHLISAALNLSENPRGTTTRAASVDSTASQASAIAVESSASRRFRVAGRASVIQATPCAARFWRPPQC